MANLIKADSSAELASVRAFTAPSAPPPIAVVKEDREVDRLNRRIAALEAELSERDCSIVKLREENVLAIEKAKSAAWQAGLSEAEDRQAERCALLELSMRQTEAALSASLASLERLAPLLAQECLNVILGDRGERVDILRRIIELQVGKIDKAMLLGIELSQEDFPDKAVVGEIAGRVGLQSAVLLLNPDLPTGSCLMKLRLGKVEVGINQQWRVLRELLDDFARPDDGR